MQRVWKDKNKFWLQDGGPERSFIISISGRTALCLGNCVGRIMPLVTQPPYYIYLCSSPRLLQKCKWDYHNVWCPVKCNLKFHENYIGLSTIFSPQPATFCSHSWQKILKGQRSKNRAVRFPNSTYLLYSSLLYLLTPRRIAFKSPSLFLTLYV